MNLDAEYKKYVEHWGDSIDPINYKLYSIETNMSCFHPDNRLFTKEEFIDFCNNNKAFKEMWKDYSSDKYGPGWRDLSEPLEGRPQDPAVCEYSGLRPVEGYKEEEIDKEDIDKEINTEVGDRDFMYKWIRDKSGK